jgi:hypothetical protein
VVASVALATVLFAVASWVRLRVAGLRDPAGMLLAAFGVLGVLGLAETVAQRVEISDDELHVTRWWVRRSYPRDSIARLTSEKGVEAALQLADGRWVKLPPVGPHAPNSIRAWLRARGGAE